MRTYSCRASQLACCALVVMAAQRGRAQAPDSLTGNWEAGPVVSDVAIESWTEACEAAPKARSSPGGAAVEVEQRGQSLSIRGAGTDIRTGACASSNPELRPIATNVNDGLWVTRCATAKGAPREEQGTYTLRALGPDRLLYQEVSLLNWGSGATVCRATVTTKLSLVRRGATRSSATPPAPSGPVAVAPTAPVDPSSCRPGAPARVSIRPREADVPLGGKQCFQVKVEDAAGCPIRDTEPAWSLEHGPAIRGSLQGNCFQAGGVSAESEGHFEVLADLGTLRGRATVHVVAHNLRDLTARRVDSVGAAPASDAGSIRPPTAVRDDRPATRFAARALGQTERVRQRVLMGIAAALAVAAAIFALSLRGRRRLRTSDEPPLATRQCPSCGAVYPDTIAYCGNDGTALPPVRRS